MLSTATILLSALTLSAALPPASGPALAARQQWPPVCGILPGVSKLCCTPEFEGELLVNPNASAPLQNLFCRVPAEHYDAYNDCIGEHTEPAGIGSEGCFASPDMLEPTTLPESIAAAGTTQGEGTTPGTPQSTPSGPTPGTPQSTPSGPTLGTPQSTPSGPTPGTPSGPTPGTGTTPGTPSGTAATASGMSTATGMSAASGTTTGTTGTGTVSAAPSATTTEGNGATRPACGPLAVAVAALAVLVT